MSFRPLLATIIQYCMAYNANNKIYSTEPEQSFDLFMIREHFIHLVYPSMSIVKSF